MMDMQTGGQGEKKVCNCPHHSLVPWIVILVGVLIIINAMGWLASMTSWVIFGVLVIIAGIAKLAGRKCKCCGKGM